MALIKCPECKKKISDQCENCPNCGFPVKRNVEAAPVVSKLEAETIKKSKEKKPINKKLLIGIISAGVILLIVGSFVTYNALLPRINAVKEFNETVKNVAQKNNELQAEISKSEELVLKNPQLLDKSLIPTLETAISDAKAVKVTDFSTPHKVKDIITRTEELNKVDYTDAIANLKETHNALEINARRFQLVNNPTEAYVINCLKTIPEIVNIAAVTEDNDPNGQLNKPGGYTATVYFSDSRIDLDELVYGTSVIEQGTLGGGGIEVYSCEEDAIARLEYLSVFDGGILTSGSHTVIGTVLVRTSHELTATQQKELEAKVIKALTYLPEIDKNDSQQTESETTTTQNTDTPTTNNTETQNSEDNKNQEAVRCAERLEDLSWVSPNYIRTILVVDYGFNESQANYAISHANIDWNNYAVLYLKSYYDLNNGNVTKSSSEEHLRVQHGFSDESIKYALANANIVWEADKNQTVPQEDRNKAAVVAAKKEGSLRSESPNKLKQILMWDYDFSESEAAYGVKHANIDWNENASSSLNEYIYKNNNNGKVVSKNDMDHYLGVEQGFPDAAIQYAYIEKTRWMAYYDETATPSDIKKRLITEFSF